MFFKMDQKVTQVFGLLLVEIFLQGPLKIAQSVHTEFKMMIIVSTTERPAKESLAEGQERK